MPQAFSLKVQNGPAGPFRPPQPSELQACRTSHLVPLRTLRVLRGGTPQFWGSRTLTPRRKPSSKASSCNRSSTRFWGPRRTTSGRGSTSTASFGDGFFCNRSSLAELIGFPVGEHDRLDSSVTTVPPNSGKVRRAKPQQLQTRPLRPPPLRRAWDRASEVSHVGGPCRRRQLDEQIPKSRARRLSGAGAQRARAP